MQKNKFTLTATVTLFLLWALFAIPVKAQQIFVFIEMHPMPPASLYQWDREGMMMFVVADNMSTTTHQAHLMVELYDEYDRLVGESRSPRVVNIAPGFTEIPHQGLLTSGGFTFLDPLRRPMQNTGIFPEGEYRLCIRLVDAVTNVVLSDEACTFFMIQGFEAPYLLYPEDGVVLSEPQLLSTVFQWTPFMGDPFLSIAYRLVMVEVLPGQSAYEALLVNQPVVQETVEEPFWQWDDKYVTPKPEASYAWSVVLTDVETGRDQTSYAPPRVIVFWPADTIPVTDPPIDIPPYDPPPEDPPAEACDPPDYTPEPATPISLGMMVDDSELHLYPRAVPIRAEAIDWDLLWLYCSGCDGGRSEEPMPVMDEVHDFTWELIDGKGSLNIPFDPFRFNQIKDSLQNIHKRITEIEDSLIQIAQDTLELPNRTEAHKARIEEKETENTGLDSLIALINDTLQVINQQRGDLFDDINALIGQTDSIQHLISNLLDEIDSLRYLLSGPPSEEELTQRTVVADHRTVLTNLQEELIKHEQETTKQSDALKQIIQDAKDVLDAAATAYNDQKEISENISKKIAEEEIKLLEDPDTRDFLLHRRFWYGTASGFIVEYAMGQHIGLYNTMDNLFSQSKNCLIETDTTVRHACHNTFDNSLVGLYQQLTNRCAALPPHERHDCIEAFSYVTQTYQDFRQTMQRLVHSEYLYPVQIEITIDSLRQELLAMESVMNAAQNQVEQSNQAYSQALSDYVEEMQLLDSQKADMQQNIVEQADSLSRQEHKYNLLVQARKDELERNREQFLEGVHAAESSINSMESAIDHLQDSLSTLYADTFGLFVIKTEFEEEKERLEALKEKNEELIHNLVDLIDALEQRIEALKRRAEELMDEMEALREQQESLEEEQVEEMAGNTSATGYYVYYIPPPLEEVMKDKGTYPRFEALRDSVKAAEDSLQLAYFKKEQVQRIIALETERIGRALVEYKKSEDQINALNDQATEAEKELARKKNEITQEFQDQQLQLQELLNSAEENLNKALQQKEDYTSDSLKVKEDLEQMVRSITQHDSLLSLLQQTIEDKQNELNNKQELLRAAERTLADQSNELEEKRRLLRERNTALSQLNNHLSRANVMGEQEAIRQVRELIKDTEDEIKTLEETDIPAKEQEVAGSAASVQSAEASVSTAREQLGVLLGNQQQKRLQARELRDSLVKGNEAYAEVLSGLEHWRRVERLAHRLIRNTNQAREELQDHVEDQIGQDEEVSAHEENLENIKQQIEEHENAKKDAIHAINESVARKERAINEADKQLAKAKANLEEAEEEFRAFLVEEFESVEIEATIRLRAKDAVIDAFRAGDEEAELIKTIRYEGSRIPVFENEPAIEQIPDEPDVASVCLVQELLEEGALPAEMTPPRVLRPEPRTIALVYEDGKPLWEEWPVFRNTDVIAKDVVEVYAEFTPDFDQLEIKCYTADGKCDEVKTLESIRDQGPYQWKYEGRNIGNHPLQNRFLWEPRFVEKPLPEEKLEIEALLIANHLAPDDPVDSDDSILVIPGVLVEVTDNLVGIPDTTMEVQARVVTGDHKGLAGEDIEFSVERMAGSSEDYGFDGDTIITVQTDGDGYAKADFDFGDGFARFRIHAKWLRDSVVIDEESFDAIAPIRLSIHRFSAGAPPFAFDAALEIIQSEGDVSQEKIDELTGDFPPSVGDDAGQDYAYVVRAIAGLLNEERDAAEDEEVLFELMPEEAGIDPEETRTGAFGLAFAIVKDLPDETNLLLKASVEDAYQPLGRPPKDQATYNTSLFDRFRIGSKDNLFVVILDEPVSEGELISGTGRLGVADDGISDGIMNELMEVSLHINEVELADNGEDRIAVAGSVSWSSATSVSRNILGFDVGVDSFVVTASLGGGIGGVISHNSLSAPVRFYAEIEPTGDFLGTIENIPAIELGGFKLREGSSFTIDMHKMKSPPGFANNFSGVVIHSASLELPAVFATEATGRPSRLHVKDFFIGSAGIGGEISYAGSIFRLGYAGYAFEADSIGLKFENDSLISGVFSGRIHLASPMEGRIRTTITAAGSGWAAEVSTDNPVSIPRLRTSFSLLSGTGIQWNQPTSTGTLTLNAIVTSETIGEVTVMGLEVNSKGEIKADEISIDKAVKFGSGFDFHLETLSFGVTEEEYHMDLKGKFGFEKIGINELGGQVHLRPGPTVSVNLESAEISFERGPVEFTGAFAYSGREFRGDFDIGIKNMAGKGAGLKGLLIVGNMEDDDDVTFNYWYAELTADVTIPLGQTGLSLLEIGGGLGYNYNPPVGNEPGSPSNTDQFSFKALIGVGNTPSGQLFAGRMEMVLVPGEFTLYGKVWLLQQESSMFGEGKLNVHWEPETKVDGYVRMFVGLPDADGGVLSFDGRINYLFSENEFFVRSEQITGSFLKTVHAEASIDVTSQHILLDGRLFYQLNRKFELGIVDIIAAIEVNAAGSFSYLFSTHTMSARAQFNGLWDLDIDTPIGYYDLTSGEVKLTLDLEATPAFVKVSGSAEVSWSVWIYSDSAELDVGYTIHL